MVWYIALDGWKNLSKIDRLLLRDVKRKNSSWFSSLQFTLPQNILFLTRLVSLFFSSYQAIIWLPLGVLRLDLVLTLSTWGWHQIPWVKGKTPQNYPPHHTHRHTVRMPIFGLKLPRLLPVPLTTGYKWKVPRTSSLASINLLEPLTELRKTVSLLDTSYYKRM